MNIQCQHGSRCGCHRFGMCDKCAVICAETILGVELRAVFGDVAEVPKGEAEPSILYGMSRMSVLLDMFGAHGAARTARGRLRDARRPVSV